MALIYTAQLNPDKPEWIRGALVARGEPEDVTFEKVGAYRFDDPAGEIGVEAMIVRMGGRLVQVPFSYRPAPLEGATVIAEAEHSVLGRRCIHDLMTDPAARAIVAAGLRGEIEQAVLEVHDEAGTYIETRQPDVRLALVDAGGQSGAAPMATDASGDVELPYELESPARAAGGRALVAEGDGFTAVVARLV